MIINRVKKQIKKILSRYDKTTNFYSQGGEDAILQGIFRQKLKRGEPGFFVDVGAYHPFIHSNTHYFYIRGWRGINIDPRPGGMDIFNKIRRRDINLETAIGTEGGTATYYLIDKDSTMNSFSQENLREHGLLEYVKEEIPILTTTLEAVFEEYLPEKEIDFLSIDVEGLDYEVLQSNNWVKFKPKVVVIELSCTTIDEIKENKTASLLIELGYNIVAKNVIMRNVASVFFVRKDFDY